jgi:hypothetical protein
LTHWLEIIGFLAGLFRPALATKQFSGVTKPFFALAQNSGNAAWLSSPQQERRTARPAETGDTQMRTVSFILAFAFMLAAPSIAGSLDNTLPGIGTFAYSGSPTLTAAPHSIVVAVR